MSKIRTQLLATATVVALSSAAYAADMGMPLKAPPPAPPPIQDWSGVYVGLEGGYGWGKENLNTAFDPFFRGKLSKDTCNELNKELIPPGAYNVYSGHVISFTCNHPTIDSKSQSGWLGGGRAGVQKQWGSLVLGLGGEFDGADIRGGTTSSNTNTVVFGGVSYGSTFTDGTRTVNSTQTINSDIDLLSMFGPKVGWAISPSWMVYATGGAAFAHLTESNSVSQTHFFQCAECSAPYPTHTDLSSSGTGGLSMFGWAIGGGLDYKWQLDPGSAVILGVEYMHYQFGSDTLSLTDNLGTGHEIGLNMNQTVDVVKGHIDYFFSIH